MEYADIHLRVPLMRLKFVIISYSAAGILLRVPITNDDNSTATLIVPFVHVGHMMEEMDIGHRIF